MGLQVVLAETSASSATTTKAFSRWPNSSSSTPITADLDDRLVVGEQVLDLAREDVLAAGDDHLVVAAVDEEAARRRRSGRRRRCESRPSITSLPPPPV